MSLVADARCDLLCLDLPLAERLRTTRLSVADAAPLAARARALADPTRLTLAAALAEVEELCVCDLSWIAERPENLVSHHLRSLRSAGLVRYRRDGKMAMYSLTDEGRALLAAVLGDQVPA
jgi:ArsR family transcriptional regulator, lead/cadmium/zinc/bismuth-responsive transcriptional repressor